MLETVQRSMPRILGVMILALGIITLGGMAAIFPIGLMARIAIAMTGVIVLMFFAMSSPQANTHWESRVGFALLILVTFLLVLWPRYLYFKLGPGPNVNALTLSVFALLLFTVGVLVRGGGPRQVFSSNIKAAKAFLVVFGLFYLTRFIAIFVSDHALAASIALTRELMLLGAVLLSALVFIDCQRKEQALVVVLLVSTVGAVLGGALELQTKKTLFEGFVTLNADDPQAVNLYRSITQKYREGNYRVQSTFDHPIVMGQFFSMMFFVCLSVVAAAKLRWRLLAVLLLPAIIFMIAKSGSRSGLSSLAIGLMMFSVGVLFIAFSTRRIKSVAQLWSAFVGLALVVTIGALYWTIFADSVDSLLKVDRNSTSARLEFLARGIPAAIASPLVGYGFGMAGIKAGVPGSDGYLTIDNYFLTIALDYGLPALILYATLHVVPVWRAFTAGLRNWEDAVLALGLASAIAVFFVVQSIVSIASNQAVVLLLCVILLRRTDARAERPSR
jgi:O-antigen ligase